MPARPKSTGSWGLNTTIDLGKVINYVTERTKRNCFPKKTWFQSILFCVEFCISNTLAHFQEI